MYNQTSQLATKQATAITAAVNLYTKSEGGIGKGPICRQGPTTLQSYLAARGRINIRHQCVAHA